jgi:soluble lytic murein transglycosylase-like protein
MIPVLLAAFLTSAAIPQPPAPAKPIEMVAVRLEKPVSRKGTLLPRYNFPAASRGDRFAREGLDLHTARAGWRRYGKLIKTIAKQEGIDPHVLGAYVWIESSFNPHQDFKHGKCRALGLGSVQAQDHPQYSVKQLKDPKLNLTLTAREFRAKWKQHDMAGTVMDVWYPAWRKKKKIPVIGSPATYVQAMANRYDALCRLDTKL